jgi:hypothetical protein
VSAVTTTLEDIFVEGDARPIVGALVSEALLYPDGARIPMLCARAYVRELLEESLGRELEPAEDVRFDEELARTFATFIMARGKPSPPFADEEELLADATDDLIVGALARIYQDDEDDLDLARESLVAAVLFARLGRPASDDLRQRALTRLDDRLKAAFDEEVAM